MIRILCLLIFPLSLLYAEHRSVEQTARDSSGPSKPSEPANNDKDQETQEEDVKSLSTLLKPPFPTEGLKELLEKISEPEGTALRKELASLGLESLETLSTKIKNPETKKYIDAVIGTKKLTQTEFYAALMKLKQFNTPEGKAMAQEFFQRVKGNPDLRFGLIASPQNIHDIQNRIKEFLSSDEGRKTLNNFKSQLPQLLSGKGKLLSNSTKDGSKSDVYQALGKAINNWDSKNGGKLQGMGLNGEQIGNIFQAFKKEIGINEMTVGIFLPDKAVQNALHSTITKEIMPFFKNDIRNLAAKKAAEEVSKEVSKHPIFAGIFKGKVNQAYAEAQSGAAEGAEDAATAQPQKNPFGGKTYNQAYRSAYEITEKQIQKAENKLQEGMYKSLTEILTPKNPDSGLTVNVLRSGPPASGNFEQDENYPGYSKKPYFSLYEKKESSDGSIRRETLTGWYATRLDSFSSNSLSKVITDGQMYEWANQFLKRK